MRRTLAWMLVMTSLGAGTTSAAQQAWVGTISDSQCGANHEGELNEHDCTRRCVKTGFQYVLVTGGKVLKIVNQNFPSLPDHAGQTVKLTGERKGDAIVVSKIETPSKAK